MSNVSKASSLSLWFVYLVRNNRNALYTGITTDVERRFAEHCGSGPKAAKALKGKGPLTLEFAYPIANRSMASQLEYRIKKLPKAKKEQLIHQPELIEVWELIML